MDYTVRACVFTTCASRPAVMPSQYSVHIPSHISSRRSCRTRLELRLQVWQQICLMTRKERKQQNPARWRSSRSIGRSSPKPHRRNTRSDLNHPLPRYAFDILLNVIDALYDDAGKVETVLRVSQFFGKAAPKPVARPSVHSVMRCKVETAGLAN